MKNRVRKTKIKNSPKISINIFLIFLGTLILAGVGTYLMYPKFYVKSYNDKTLILFGDELIYNSEICYGNKIVCNDIKPDIEGDYDINKLGEYNVNYVYKYKSSILTKAHTITVIDNVPPVLKIEAGEYYYCPNGKEYKYDVTATDNYDGELTDKIELKIEENKLVYKVKDSSLNEGILEVDAIPRDSDLPEIILKGSSTKYIVVGNKYIEEGATASDYCDGNLTDKIVVSGNVDTSVAGKYILNYNVSDSSSNESSVKRTVYVINKNNPVTPGGKSIYLTFDDGPSKYTSKLLDILAKYDVKATFFVTNQSLTNGYDYVIKRAYDEGHTIGLHTNSHIYSNIYSSVDNYFKDLDLIQNKVKNITGNNSMLVRLPGGSSNTVSKKYDNGQKVMTKITCELENRGYKYFDWNVMSGDTGGTTNTNTIISNVKNSLGNNSTYVVLQHDIKSYSVDAVESIIIYGLANDYIFRPLTLNSPTVHHSLNN